MEIPNSSGQTAPKTPTGSTSPVHEERIAQQENTDEGEIWACRPDPDHPGEYRCRPSSNPVLRKTVNPVITPSAGSPSQVSGQGNSTNPDAEVVETWVRSDGMTIDVRQVECDGKMLYEQIATIPHDSPTDPQSRPVQTTKQNLSVGRIPASRYVGRIKTACVRPGRHTPTDGKPDDSSRERP